MTAAPLPDRSALLAFVTAPFRLVYGLYALIASVGITLLALVCILVLPGLAVRRSVARLAARCVLWAIGMPLRIHGLEHLPPGQCVVVANHASYLDGIVMTAALPARFGFVIKREMNDVPLAGLLLRRIGSEFVERFNRHKGASDTRRVLRNAANGHSLVFFPEGTFTSEVGLGKFHTGAFAIAARAGCPVVPAVILGTRHNMPAKHLLPRPGVIDVRYGAPIPVPSPAQGGERIDDPVLALRDRSRAAILQQLGEPDLCA